MANRSQVGVVFEGEAAVQHAFWRGLEGRLARFGVNEAGLIEVRALPAMLFGVEASAGSARLPERCATLAMSFPSDQWLADLPAGVRHAVNIGHFSRISRAPTVAVDDAWMGRRAAEHFLAEEVEAAVVFIGDGSHGQALRREGFARVLEGAEFPACRRIEVSVPLGGFTPAIERVRREFAGVGRIGLWLADAGLADRFHAWRREDPARAEGWLVLEVFNEIARMEAETGRRSGFAVPAEAMGAALAEVLVEMLQGRPVANETLVLPTLTLSETAFRSKRRRVANRLRKWLDANAHRAEANVALAGMEIKVSRRTLETAFRATFGLSPGKYLQNLRLTRVESELRTGNLRIVEIAEQCGYQSQHYLCAAFKKRHGCAPTEYRRDSK